MAEHADKPKAARRRSPMDLLTLICGVIALLVAVYTFSDGNDWLPLLNLRWVLAAGAVTIGLALLAGSLRSRRQD
ncbi:uncharacterized membrane protein HdeD (DUF308 family) [Actinoalloteichus hoggarensis]|uniref:Uncharacterized protein n=1 Tax=Actinoalloteichus hoggarensis TaxID=1470176 RepID=A0A221WAR0_9PSEU|nr:hypothetical protein [Actinoalloteichus hoggarensis]ASO22733.1 hypothetical protein AHOG_25640 [Actinoalloteichus hoggarensis]MBB5924125.1 uncharacterized membrane protein HdeD (DUF308 family) [Actinoalloteichus hoggarensis]